jgi:hypothetical protein
MNPGFVQNEGAPKFDAKTPQFSENFSMAI